MTVRNPVDYGAVSGGDSTAALRAAWDALEPGDLLDLPPGEWLGQPAAAGYELLRANRDNVSIRIAPGAVLGLLPGGRDGMVIGTKGGSGARTGLQVYGGGTLRGIGQTYPVVTWGNSAGTGEIGDLSLDGIVIDGGEDGVYLGARTTGTVRLHNVAVRNPYRYGVAMGNGGGGAVLLTRCHLDRPRIASAVPHALHVESGVTSARVEVFDHTTVDASLAFNGAGGGWRAEDVVLRDGVILAANAPGGVIRRCAVRWKRPPNASPRPVLLTGGCHGTVIEDVIIDNEWPDNPGDAKPAIVATTSTGCVLRRARILTPAGTLPYAFGANAQVDAATLRVVSVPA